MTKTIISDSLAEALKSDPESYLKALNQRLTEARMMVWQVIVEKKFAGFEDAERLVKAYDHLDKVLDIFLSYQLPLPLKEEENIRAKDKKQPVLPLV